MVLQIQILFKDHGRCTLLTIHLIAMKRGTEVKLLEPNLDGKAPRLTEDTQNCNI